MGPANMLEMQKLVLENVHEDKSLFEKELRKSFNWLEYDDLIILYNWAMEEYSDKYFNLINCIFLGFGFLASNNYIPTQL
jgi:hypothetical protein